MSNNKFNNHKNNIKTNLQIINNLHNKKKILQIYIININHHQAINKINKIIKKYKNINKISVKISVILVHKVDKLYQ